MMKKSLGYTLLPLLAAIALFSCGTNTPLVPGDDESILSFGSDQSLEIVTWNLRTFPLDQASIQTIAQIIPQMRADIIAFQEIMDSSAFHELANLIPNYSAHIYNATSSYRLAYLYDTRVVRVNDVYTIYEGQTNPFPRAPYVLDFDFQGRNFKVINNHLKAYGDNYIDESDPWDEECRRRLACQMLDQYIVENLPNDNVIVVGDMNDQIAEPEEYNVFQVFLGKPEEYRFADMHIALAPTYNNVSYPPYVSHIDHILVTNELFDALDNANSVCRVIRVDEFMGSWQNYFNQISDHRPLGVKLFF